MKQLIKKVIGRRTIEKGFKTVDTVNGMIGQLILPLAPNRAKLISESGFSFYQHHRRGPIDTLIRAGLARQALKSPDPDAISEYHRKFWEGQGGKDWADLSKPGFDQWINDFAYIFDDLQQILEHHPNIKTLCEIGTGAGEAINYLENRFPQIERFIGIDLSEEVIETNKKSFSNPKFEFVAADGEQYIYENGQADWIYFTFGGVLEYFSQNTLEKLFTHLAEGKRPSIFVCVEPVGVDHDFEKQKESQVYYREFTLSHNYPHLFEKSGFEIQHLSFKEFFRYRYCLVIATAGI